jgi:monoterpene epsilon-lactone hydrolase
VAGPEIQVVIDMLRANPPIAGADILEMRAGMEATAGIAPLPEDVRFDPVDAGGVPAEWTAAPGASDDRVVLYFHGGGYVMGSITTHRGVVAGISHASGARVLSVDYRLAPEDPHPAAVEDGVAAYRFLLAQGIAPESIAIAGDSAGGGLTLATLVALREAGEKLPAAGVCISPWADLTQSGETMETKAAEDPMVSRDLLQQMADAYLSGGDARAQTASPGFADLSGLPPLLVQVGSAEVLLDDARNVADRAKASGVDVTLEEWDDMIHVWHAFALLLPEARAAIERIGEYLKGRLR